ncbi:MAG: hypothetical protein L3I91_02240 [Mycoplasma sp.]
MNQLKFVNGKNVKVNLKNFFDQYFTKQTVAEKLFNVAYNKINKIEKKQINDFVWIEPSVGEGCFFDLLPKKKRIGIDIKPLRSDVVKSDYLKYPIPTNKKIIVIGNPPFGHRGTMALEFINHSYPSDYVCFILPMFFSSVGKGSIRYRVKNYHLLHEEELKPNSFYLEGGKTININCVFQIWSKKQIKKHSELNWYSLKNKQEPFNKLLSAYTVSTAKKRECGKHWIFNEKADFYIASTFFKNNKIVFDFKDVKYNSGIAVKYNTKNKRLIKRLNKLFMELDWTKYATRATNSCYHIGKTHIYKALMENGFKKFY